MKHLVYLLLFVGYNLFAQHTISGTIKTEKPYSYVLVYQATPTGSEYITQSQFKENGEFEIKIDSSFKPGIYKIVYALPAETYNFNFLVDTKEDIKLEYQDSLGTNFLESNENKLWQSYSRSMELIHSAINNYYSQGSEDKSAYDQIIRTMAETQKSYEENSKGLLSNVLIRANRPYIPPSYEEFMTYAKNVREHYLDPIDFNSDIILSSDYITSKLLAYVFGMSNDTSDEYYLGQMNQVFEKIKQLPADVQLSIMYPVWEQLYAYGKDDVARKLVDAKMLDLAKNAKNELMIEIFENFKLNGIGSIAPDFKIDDTTNGKNIHTTLLNLSASEYYLLVFWSSGCSHCIAELPILKEKIKPFKNVKVVAFALEDDDKGWSKMVKDYPDFIHVLGLKKWENETVNQYSIQSTPSFIVLDKNKKIINKPEQIEDIIEFFNSMQ